MADFPSLPELFRVGRDKVLETSKRLTREVLDREGTDANALVAAAAAIGDECIGQLVRVESSLFLASAQKKKLDRLVFDRYNMTRKPASPSVGSVSFSTTAANPTAFAIPVNTRLQTRDGKTFLTTATAIFPSGTTGPIVVAVRSSDAGLSQQAARNTITAILDMPIGAPGDLVCNNPLATAGGDNEEQDDALRERARQFFVSARRGTAEALRSAGESVVGVRKVTVIEALDGFGRPTKAVSMVIADAFTEALVDVTPTPGAYQTQSQILASQVFTALDDWRACGIYVDIQVGVVSLLGVQLGLTFQTGVSYDSVALRARSEIVAYVNELRPGATFDVANAVDRLRRVPGLVVTGNEILGPVGNVIPKSLEVLRTTLGLVIASSLQPDRALQGSANPDGVQ
jgi:hypothetical protein